MLCVELIAGWSGRHDDIGRVVLRSDLGDLGELEAVPRNPQLGFALALTDDGRQLRDAFWRRLTSDPGPIAPLTPIQVRQLGEISAAIRDGISDTAIRDPSTSD